MRPYTDFHNLNVMCMYVFGAETSLSIDIFHLLYDIALFHGSFVVTDDIVSEWDIFETSSATVAATYIPVFCSHFQ